VTGVSISNTNHTETGGSDSVGLAPHMIETFELKIDSHQECTCMHT
jgi:hypothetical protein